MMQISPHLKQSGHKPGKLRESEKLSKYQENLNFHTKKPGKLKENAE